MIRIAGHRFRISGKSMPVTSVLLLGFLYASGAEVWAGDSEANRPVSPPLPFTLPPGFHAKLVAAPPMVEHPMTACFNDQGGLFVSESAGMNRNGYDLVKDPPNSILLLEDTQKNGTFDKRAVFADKMTFPAGVLWHDGALYTASAPYIWKLQDSKGKGIADQRQQLVGKFHFTGIADDIHGPFLGPDGWLYWCEGCHGHDIEQPDGFKSKSNAARIFRSRPDGRQVEAICGGGMNNPVEMIFTPEGEPLASVNLLWNRPRMDGIIYCIDGGVYPYRDVLKELKRTGDLLPPVADLGWIAISGLMRYRGTALGADFQNNLFSTQFNTHRVQRHIWTRAGAAFSIRTEDFLVSTNPDFHPTDVLEDADGSLLVVDTGGWFRNGCPTSQIAKPQFKGAIYRIWKDNAPGAADPRGQAISWNQLGADELAPLLDDPRFPVRDRALLELSKRGTGSLPALRSLLSQSPSVRARRNAVWALTRMEIPEARAAVRGALADRDFSVRLAAAHSASLFRDLDAAPRLLELLTTAEPAMRRTAAAALGRMRQLAAVPALLNELRTAGDRFLEHALTFALIQIGDREATLAGLKDSSPVVRRGALIALDQMDGGSLTRAMVTPLLAADDPALVRATVGVITSRPGWARETLGLLGQYLAGAAIRPDREETVRGIVSAFCADPAVQDLVAATLRKAQTPDPVRLLVLETMARAPLDKLPSVWIGELRWALDSSDERIVRQAVECIRVGKVAEFDEALLRLARDPARGADLRVAAAAALIPRLPRIDVSLLEFLQSRLNNELPPLARLAAAEALGNASLGDAQLNDLTKFIAGAGALELPHLLLPYAKTRKAEVGKNLAVALDRAASVQSLTAESVKRTFQEYPPEVQELASRVLKKLDLDTEKQRIKLVELEPVIAAGDSKRGREVFFGRKAACAACHTVQAEGGRIGPDLSKIGGIRTGRDLLESIIFPSASIVRGFEPFTVTTQSGKLHTGIICRETAEAIYLINAERAELRIPRNSIETVERSRVSIMPQGLDGQLSKQELADTIAFLRSLK